MLQRIRAKLTYANVISTICMFLLLGGGAYAATKLPANSVGTAQLKKNAVTGAKVKDGSLSGTDIDVASLGTVPSASSSSSAITAQTAARAGTAGRAGTADRAQTAGSATSAGTATHADTATSANTAGTAGTATNATHATNADDAQTLDGTTAAELKVRCPAGTSPAAGACIDDQPSDPAPLYEAFQLCGEEDARLPTQGELIAYVQQYVDSSLTEWIEPQVVAENTFKGLLITSSKVESSLSIFDPFSSQPYRCVTTAAN